MHFCKGAFFHKVNALCEIFFGFTGKTDYKVGGYGTAGESLTQKLNLFVISFRGIFAVHIFEGLVAAALHGQMKLGAEVVKILYFPDKILVDRPGFQRPEAYSDIGNSVAYTFDERGERGLVIKVKAVRAYLNACYDNFFVSRLSDFYGVGYRVI